MNFHKSILLTLVIVIGLAHIIQGKNLEVSNEHSNKVHSASEEGTHENHHISNMYSKKTKLLASSMWCFLAMINQGIQGHGVPPVFNISPWGLTIKPKLKELIPNDPSKTRLKLIGDWRTNDGKVAEFVPVHIENESNLNLPPLLPTLPEDDDTILQLPVSVESSSLIDSLDETKLNVFGIPYKPIPLNLDLIRSLLEDKDKRTPGFALVNLRDIAVEINDEITETPPSTLAEKALKVRNAFKTVPHQKQKKSRIEAEIEPNRREVDYAVQLQNGINRMIKGSGYECAIFSSNPRSVTDSKQSMKDKLLSEGFVPAGILALRFPKRDNEVFAFAVANANTVDENEAYGLSGANRYTIEGDEERSTSVVSGQELKNRFRYWTPLETNLGDAIMYDPVKNHCLGLSTEELSIVFFADPADAENKNGKAKPWWFDLNPNFGKQCPVLGSVDILNPFGFP